MNNVKTWLILAILVLSLNQTLAYCKSDQINVNTASQSSLDKLTGIGEVKAQAIIDTRPYETLEDLINVYGIGPATLEKIKDQGLACIDSEEIKDGGDKTIIEKELADKTKSYTLKKSDEDLENLAPQNIINLNSEEKIEEVVYESKSEKINKNLFFGFGIFLIGVVYLLIRK